MTDAAPDAITRRAARGDLTKPLQVVVLVSGSGSLLQALIDAEADAAARGQRSPFTIVAVGADRECTGLERATLAGIPTFVVATSSFADRAQWDAALADAVDAQAAEASGLPWLGTVPAAAAAWTREEFTDRAGAWLPLT